MWLYMTGEESPKQIVLYGYKTIRASKLPKEFLEGFQGYLLIFIKIYFYMETTSGEID